MVSKKAASRSTVSKLLAGERQKISHFKKGLPKFNGNIRKLANIKQGASKSNLLTRCHWRCANNHNHTPAKQ